MNPAPPTTKKRTPAVLLIQSVSMRRPNLVRLPLEAAGRESVEPALVGEAVDLARQEARLHEQRPEIADVVVHLVIVHFAGRREAELERRKLEENLAAPGRYVHEAGAAGAQDPPDFLQRAERLREVLEHGHDEHEVDAPLGERNERLREPAFECLHLGVRLEVGSNRHVDEDGALYFGEHGAREARLVPAAEIGDYFAAEARKEAPDLARGEPNAEAIDQRGRVP